MYSIDPNRIELAREFKATPWGEHSPDLQYLLHLMRKPGREPFPVLFMTEAWRRWTLAWMDPARPGAPQLTNTTFDDLREAEWHVFKLRWKAMTGVDLELD